MGSKSNDIKYEALSFSPTQWDKTNLLLIYVTLYTFGTISGQHHCWSLSSYSFTLQEVLKQS